jgi:hypothetical protein
MDTYTDVKYKPATGEITGRRNNSLNFSADIHLFSVSLAIELEPKSLRTFMKLADGYGSPGYFPGGYDWSGIRDSTPEAHIDMDTKARAILSEYRLNLEKAGLPKRLVSHLCSQEKK